MPETLYDITRRYEWSDRYEDAKRIFQKMTKNYTASPFAKRAQLGSAKITILSLIMSGEYNRAKELIDELVANFSKYPGFPNALYDIAKRYEWADKYEEAKNTYHQIMQNYPDTSLSKRVVLDFSRVNILSLILSKNYAEADNAIAQLMTGDFSEHLDFPSTLFWIAERYRWADKYEEAKRFYQQIIQNYPNNSYASRAALGFSRADILSLILSQKYTQTMKAVDTLLKDFSDNVDLMDTLYDIARRLEWANMYEDSKYVYEQIIRKYPNSAKFEAAQLGFARANIYYLIIKGQWAQVRSSIDKMAAQFAKNPDLPETLYDIAQRYEWSDNFDEAKTVYQQIYKNYPNSSYANKSKLSASRMNILSLMVAGNYSQAERAINKLISNFSENPDLPEALYNIAHIYAWLIKYEEARNLYQKIISDYPDSSYAAKAEMGLSGLEVVSKILSNNNGLDKASISTLIVNYSGQDNLPGMLYWIAAALQKEGRYTEAIEAADISIANSTPSYSKDQDYYLKGFCYYQLDNYKEALICYDKLLNEFSSSKMANDARMQKGRMLYFQGRYQESVDAFKSVLYNNPSETLAKEAEQNIKDIEKVFLNKTKGG
jgi:TolA-binding protein